MTNKAKILTNKREIRKEILKSVGAYKKHLVGKYFLYVFDGQAVEVTFKIEHFKHLTGIDSMLYAKDFYRKASNRTLTTEQIFFSAKHPYKAMKKKIQYLHRLSELTSKDVIILKEVSTQSIVYKVALTNLDFTLCLKENINRETKEKINHFYIPQSLRVRDRSFENSTQQRLVEFIFMKRDEKHRYNVLMFGDREALSTIPESIRDLISPELFL